MTAEQRAAIDAQLRAYPFDVSAEPAQMRAAFEAFAGAAPAALPALELGGRPALEWAGAGGTILYFHGGSWIVGSPATAQRLTSALVRRTGLRAVSLDYRLAPEHPFPAAIEDAVAAYRALVAEGEPIVLAGDSAGGGLAVITAIVARDEGLPRPAGVVAFSPGLDATRTGESMTTKEGVDPLFTRAGLQRLSRYHLAGQDPRHPWVSPAVVGDLTGLPPVLLQVGTNEVLLDDSVRFAARAAAAGVDVILDVTGDVPHVFQTFEGVLDEADAALDRAAQFIRARTSRQ
ncbi:alpha/beta hydrolase [Cryptosporangium phraense]|uniref:Alpha/beta hydrolase n=1 Tax=Cryptosporangium phraense TaxID=2593070 RepID=A0A545AYJ9_9ACTN|nr:alpha/beta hydrolase [Cryptosporangium phraense]TQS46410.1 alpha/beta hydrolase [Cryptosporangium phraense]